MENTEQVFDVLNSLNVNDHVEKKDTGKAKLSYLSWPWAWASVAKRYPDANYRVKMFDGKPYTYDPKTGYMVFTEVTINGVTREMWLPVMDGRNDSMLDHPVEHTNSYGKRWTTEAATSFDINKTLMRCLTKNLSMFGLGLYIYAGEDLPETDADKKEAAKQEIRAEAKAEADAKTYEDVKGKLIEFMDTDIMSEEEVATAKKAIDNKSIVMMQKILACCVNRNAQKQGA